MAPVSEAEILERIRQFLSEIVADVDPAAVTPDAIIADLAVESLAAVELVARLESHFDVVFPDEEVAEVVSVQDVIDLVQRCA